MSKINAELVLRIDVPKRHEWFTRNCANDWDSMVDAQTRISLGELKKYMEPKDSNRSLNSGQRTKS